MVKKVTLLIATIFLVATSHAQSLETIAALKDQCQSCLDSGVNMQGCARKYCMLMYSMVDTVYSHLFDKLSKKERTTLEKEQKAWVKKRDKYEKQQIKDFQQKFNSGEWGPDMFMFVYESVAEYNRWRAEELVYRMYSQGLIEKSAFQKHVDSLIKNTKEYKELLDETKYTMKNVVIVPVDLRGDTIFYIMRIYTPGFNSNYSIGYGVNYSKKQNKITGVVEVQQ